MAEEPAYMMSGNRLSPAPHDRDKNGQAGSLRGLRELLRYLKPYRGRLLFGLGALLVGSVANLCFPVLAGGLIDAALHGGFAALPGLGLLSVDAVAGVLVVVIAMQAATTITAGIAFGSVGQRALADLRRDAYGRLITLPMVFFSQRRVGELTSRISGDVAQLEGSLAVAFPQFCRQSLLLFGGLVLITVTSRQLTLVMLCVVPVLVAAAVTCGRKLRCLARDAQDRLAETGTIVEETLSAIASVKAFANEWFEFGRYGTANLRVLHTSLVAVRWRSAFIAVSIVSMFGGVVLVLWFGAHLMQRGAITGGELTRFLLYTLFIGGAMGQLAELYSQVQRAVGASERLRELLHERPEVVAPSQGAALLSAGRGKRLRGDVEFAGVTFCYPARPEIEVLCDISLRANAGEIVALVGPSGAGKSTLTALLFRFYAMQCGCVSVDGRDIREYDLLSLRSQMALVPQDVVLFGGSIAENIRYGNPGASDPEVRAAAKQANAAEFIERFPDRYATIVGDRGLKLSGGQRQRIAIARAILKNPAILVLDEATSSLDSQSERLVQEALESLMQGRTTFVIAHRLATIRRAHQILVLDRGRIVEAGTHEQLMLREEGLYRQLSTLQFQRAMSD